MASYGGYEAGYGQQQQVAYNTHQMPAQPAAFHNQPPPHAGPAGYGHPQLQTYPQPQAQQPYPQPSPHYGAYNQQAPNMFAQHAWQAMQFNTEEEFQYEFNRHKTEGLGGIQAEELFKILNNCQRIQQYYGINWSFELCKIMIAMLDRSKDGMMQYPEFRELLNCLVLWHRTFKQYDTNNSGFMEGCELFSCFKNTLHYNLSAVSMETILKRYARAMSDGRVLLAFDDFVACCVRLRAYTEAFRARDRALHQNHETGDCNFKYDDFLQCVMCL